MQTRGSIFRCAANRRARSAFTLVELLVVVAIMVLAVGALLPALGSFFDSARAPDARNLMSAHLAGARNYAVANNTTTALVFVEDDETDGPMRTLMFLAESSDQVDFTAVAGRELSHLPNNIVVSANTDGDSGFPDREVVVCFLASGQLTALSSINDIKNIDDDVVVNGVGSVTSFYLYDFAGSGNPVELDQLSINYYTGAVIEQ